MLEVGTIYDICCYFFIYSFIGWCCEVIFAAIKEGRFVNRGFLNGPVCPIYGFGVIFVLLILWGVKDNFLLLFFGSVLLTSVLEYITGYILEKFFRMRWWDYSGEHFNIRGYVCLKFSIMWGLACLIVVDIVHPTIAKGTALLPREIGIVVLCIFFFWFLADIIVTGIGINNTGKYLKVMSVTSQQLRKISDSLGENLSSNTINLVQKGDTLKENFDEKYDKKLKELEQQKLSIQKKYNELRKKKPLTAKRIFSAFPDLHLLENNINIKPDKNIFKNEEKYDEEN